VIVVEIVRVIVIAALDRWVVTMNVVEGEGEAEARTAEGSIRSLRGRRVWMGLWEAVFVSC
jgi:hypothetical protein